MSRRDQTSPGIAPPSAQPASAQPASARPASARPTEAAPPIRPSPPNPACAVADMLLAPAFLCHRARCRRHRACSLPGATAPDPDIPIWQPETCFPRCIAEAKNRFREEFLLILAILMHIEKLLEPGVVKAWSGNIDTDDTGPHIRAALTLAARRLPRGDPLLAEFRAFWREEAARGDGDDEAFADGV
ncbi:hypothetical protein C8J32_102712 [Rhizobium sp. PP-CC-3A-592]|nr:hypothetical protein C8J32_102712 [Rhizobium sp. PP-CC-3A-592]